MRYFIELSYKGANYHGWQKQPNAHTIQAEIERCLEIVLRKETEIVGCGRTDTGVNARHFYAHFDGASNLETEKLCFQLNSILPHDIAFKRIFPVHDSAHARFDATSRTYEYLIYRRKDPFLEGRATFFGKPLDIEKMNKAAGYLFGKNDFSSFSKANTQVFTNNCDLKEAFWQQKEELLVFTVKADRFLRNMVRAMVGTLLDIGASDLPPETIINILEEKNRMEAGRSVPACGLYLTRVEYPYIHD